MKKGHGCCLVVCCSSDPVQLLNPGKTITSDKYAQHVDETHRKLQRLQPALVSRTGPCFSVTTPDRMSHNQLQTLNKLGYKVLPHLIHSPDLSPTFSRILTTFCRKKPPGCRKCFPRVHQNPKHRFLCYRNKETYFSLAKMY